MQDYLLDYKHGLVKTNTYALSVDFRIEHEKILKTIDDMILERPSLKRMFFMNKDSVCYLVSKNGFVLLCSILFDDIDMICKYIDKFDSIEKEFGTEQMLIERALSVVNNHREKLLVDNFVLKTEKAKDQLINDYKSFVENSKTDKPTWLVAKDYGWEEKKMVDFLIKEALLYKVGDTLMIMDPYINKGYTSISHEEYKDRKGYKRCRIAINWTKAGRMYIYELMKKNGVLPLCERGGK